MTIESVRSGQWVRRFRTGPAAPSARLICFPHAGGSATFYFPVAKQFPADVEVLAIQYPGRQDRRGEACVEDVRVLADRVAEELAELADQPFALFGHSLGATVAFETALRLQEERGVSPVRLYASGRRAPSCHREESLHLRDDAHLIEEMKQMDGTDSQVFANEEILRMVLPSFRSDYRAAETYRYRPGPALDCPVTALTGDADPHVTRDEAQAWGRHTNAGFTLRVYPGGHFFLVPHAGQIMREVGEQLLAAV